MPDPISSLPLAGLGAGPLGDVTSWGVQQALRGYAARQRTIADNVANLATPGFIAHRVSFENALEGALRNNGRGLATTHLATVESQAPTDPSGNNVSLDDETLEATKAQLGYQTMVEAMNAKFRLLRTAIAERP